MKEKIEWDELKYDLLDEDVDERMKVYVCLGYDERGNKYSGIATFFCDELESIQDIEPA